ncbi:hypothetical protein OO015_00425 [Thermomicrobium sp. 4228-Ro]|uniref:hypothetical protein n=1 Tax=Thermomicrobium sp. 4228-Ro TaxID=2993937 RepID=UPI0022491FB5|nr:hypothetical protein [Thermomicrobium sp. 4228-Ro]MCX2725972.1 hypothetical protein [Thermomicrobium sp. 4228-Ro]
MARLRSLELELAKLLDLKPRRPRRKPPTRSAVEAAAVQGIFEYLYDLTHRREAAAAQRLIEELEAIPEPRLAEAALDSMERMLIEKHPRGETIFRTLRSKAPERLGRGYAMYRIFQDPAMVVEELFYDYLDYRR